MITQEQSFQEWFQARGCKFTSSPTAMNSAHKAGWDARCKQELEIDFALGDALVESQRLKELMAEVLHWARPMDDGPRHAVPDWHYKAKAIMK